MVCLRLVPQKDEAVAARTQAAAAEDAQKAIADMMVQAQSQMAKEAGAVRFPPLLLLIFFLKWQ